MANTSRSMARRRSRTALTWVDFLVIAAIVLTFAAVVTTTVGRARASTPRTYVPAQTSEIAPAPGDATLGLIKARVRLTQGGPWG